MLEIKQDLDDYSDDGVYGSPTKKSEQSPLPQLKEKKAKAKKDKAERRKKKAEKKKRKMRLDDQSS